MRDHQSDEDAASGARHISEQDKHAAALLKQIVKQRREEQNLTQTDLARLMGISKQTVSLYLNAHIAMNASTLVNFCRLLCVSPETVRPDASNAVRLAWALEMMPEDGRRMIAGAIQAYLQVPFTLK